MFSTNRLKARLSSGTIIKIRMNTRPMMIPKVSIMLTMRRNRLHRRKFLRLSGANNRSSITLSKTLRIKAAQNPMMRGISKPSAVRQTPATAEMFCSPKNKTIPKVIINRIFFTVFRSSSMLVTILSEFPTAALRGLARLTFEQPLSLKSTKHSLKGTFSNFVYCPF